MASGAMVLEGTWEEMRARDAELAGRRVKVIVLPTEDEGTSERSPVLRRAAGPSTARSLLRYAGTWAGDDLERCLDEVYATRSRSEFPWAHR